METILITKALGIYMLVAGISLLLNKDNFNHMVKELMKEEGALFGLGIFTVILGAFLVAAHNVWELGWPLVITLLAWIVLLKGSLIFVFPKQMNTFFKNYMKKVPLELSGVIALVIGIMFLYVGYVY